MKKDQGFWGFLPPIHRPGGKRERHDDFIWPFSLIKRTWTSFELRGLLMVYGNQQHWINRDTGENFIGPKPDSSGSWYPKPWPQPGEWQSSLICFGKPGEEMQYGNYYARTFKNKWAIRFGPRFSDDVERTPEGNVTYFYVNYIPIPIIGWLLTFGFKKLK